MTTILILGGYGYTGSQIASFLLSRSDCNIVVAGRNETKALALASKLNQEFSADRVEGLALDVSDIETLRKVLSKIDMVVNAGPLFSPEIFQKLVEIVIESKCDWVDVQFDPRQVVTLEGYLPKIEEAGLTFATQAGFHPGIPAAMVKLADKYYDELEVATVSSIIRPEGGFKYSQGVPELIDMFKSYTAHYWENKEWKTFTGSNSSDYKKIEFDYGFGSAKTLPLELEEMFDLPTQIPTLKSTGFWIAGFGFVADFVVAPIIMIGIRVAPWIKYETWGKLLCASTKLFPKSPFGTVVQLECEGILKEKRVSAKMSIFGDDEYKLTAVPTVALIEQILDASIKRPGLHYAAQLVEPARFFNDIEEMGIKVKKLDH